MHYFMFGTTSLSASMTSWWLMPSLMTMKMVSSPAIVPII